MTQKKILFISPLIPCPPEKGGNPRTYEIFQTLHNFYKVHLISFIEDDREKSFLNGLAPETFDLIPKQIHLGRSWWKRPLVGLSSAFSRLPYNFFKFKSETMKRQVNKMLQTGGFNAIHIEHLNLWPFVPEGFPVLKVLHQHNLEWLSIKRFADISLNPAKKIFGWMDSIKLKAAEKEACEQADKVLAVSDDVKQRLLSLTNGKIDVSVVRTGIDTEAWRPGDGPCDSSKITFVGKMDYPPNVDGVLWFSSVVFPLIKRWIPSAKFVVVGSNPVSAVRALRRRPGIQVTGFVEDVRPHLRESAVGVFPLRYGGGVKFKILEAMSLGVPTVTTSIGVEGILADSGAEVFVEDKPQAFAQRVIALMTDRGLRLELARRARRRILSLYTREQMRVDIKEAYENLWSR